MAWLGLFQGFLRLVLAFSVASGFGPGLDRPVSSGTMDLVLIMFLVIGVLGIITSMGIWMMRAWGFWGTMLLSAGTIAFDIWAAVTVQSTAILGLVLPVLFISYLFARREKFLGREGK